MSIELWKAIFDWSAVVFVGLSIIAGSLALITGKKVGDRQDDKLRDFSVGLTAAQTNLETQKERTATAEANIALAQQHASEADAKAESFRLDIAKANESASRAQAQVAEATAEAAKANLELAKLKMPRVLSAEQQARVTANIAGFAGTPYDLWISTDSDSAALMQQIDAALTAAKWEFHPAGIVQFAGKAGIIADSGIAIHFADERSNTLQQPAIALANALKVEGIEVKAVYRDGPEAEKDKDKGRIHVMIGSKPLD